MPRRKARKKNTFLPNRGQASDSEADNFVVNCFVEILRALWLMIMCVAIPAWALVRFVCWDAWKPVSTEDK